jgi:hypothetical protein
MQTLAFIAVPEGMFFIMVYEQHCIFRNMIENVIKLLNRITGHDHQYFPVTVLITMLIVPGSVF